MLTCKKASVVLSVLALLVLFAICPAPAAAQEYEPTVGQEGKDVIWVPTPEELIQAMLDAAKVTPNDFVMDLGSGDGRIVIAAAKRGAHALGIEYNPDMVALSIKNAEKAGVSDKASFKQGDIFETDFSRATVITMYLLPNLNLRLRPKILDLKPGTRVVSHAFSMNDWNADQTIQIKSRTAYLWIVPAKVAGTWSSESGEAELQLTQNYQMLSGNLKIDGQIFQIQSGKLEGNSISFSAGADNSLREFAGHVNGRSIEGTIKTANSGERTWTLTCR
jgi:hypothetical protein